MKALSIRQPWANMIVDGLTGEGGKNCRACFDDKEWDYDCSKCPPRETRTVSLTLPLLAMGNWGCGRWRFENLDCERKRRHA